MADKRDYYDVLGVSKEASEEEIKNSWKQDLQNFEKIRTKYRIYQD